MTALDLFLHMVGESVTRRCRVNAGEVIGAVAYCPAGFAPVGRLTAAVGDTRPAGRYPARIYSIPHVSSPGVFTPDLRTKVLTLGAVRL